MKISKQEYSDMVKKASPPSPKLKNSINAFLFGGLICTIGELLSQTYSMIFSIEEAKALVPATLIIITAILTGLGIFDNIARYAGAGTIVPITGFANAVSAPAIEAKTEGYILGVGAKIFTIAGPVILYGTVASVIAGFIFYFTA
ncbi:MAG: stage V sporulation protein AC [Clostridia bacterium]|nr:stage V sporulation protein AC [Clostridia bacterium]